MFSVPMFVSMFLASLVKIRYMAVLTIPPQTSARATSYPGLLCFSSHVCFARYGMQLTADGACSNTCKFARDGVCDDRRALGVCDDGTDCQDCGPWNHSNYTLVSEVAHGRGGSQSGRQSNVT